MDYNTTIVSVGRIRSYNGITGEIVSKEGVYIFTEDSILEGENISKNDIVAFRGELVQDVRVAYFVKKVTPTKLFDSGLYKSSKSIKLLKGND